MTIGDPPTRPLRHDDLWSIPVPSSPAITPDGTQVAYVLTTPDREKDDYRSTIWVVPVAGGDPRQLTNGPHDAAPVWSPDGTRLAFLAAREGAPAQIYVLPAAGGEASRLTDLPLGAGQPVWAPDGSALAFAAPVDLDGADPGDAASARRPVATSRLGYKADGSGLLRNCRAHLFVVPAEGGTARQVTFGDHSVSAPAWSPDGRRLAYSTSMGTDRDLEFASVVHSVPAGGGLASALSPPDAVLQVGAWSPDGSWLLVVGQERLRAGNSRLYALPAEGGPLNVLLPGYDRNVMIGAPGYPGATPMFVDDGERILFCARERGAVHIMSAPSTGAGEPDVVAGGDRVVAGLTAAPGGELAFAAGSSTSPGEIWMAAAPGESERPLTDLFHAALPDVQLLEPRAEEFAAPDGTELHGWVLGAENDEPRPGPLLLDIHGGPHNAWGPVFDGFHLYHQTLAAAGWTILTLNPRGSDGYGDEFMASVAGGWGTADEGDFLAAVDRLVADGLADPHRIAVSGYSYGGYMTCWLTSRTSRFAAAVAGGCVSDLLSVTGTSDLGRYLAQIELHSSAVDGRDAIVAMSPLAHVGTVRTPTLLLHGERDDRCPVSQAEQWFTALREQRVEVEMVRYPEASHLFILNGKPSHRVDYGKRLEEWATRHTTAGRRRRAGAPRVAAGDLQRRLDAVIERHRVVGASLAVLAGDEVTTAASGLLNHQTRVPATADSFFQIGSITKTYTATLVMQLAEEGRLDLDAPVAEVLPDLRLADPEVNKTVTMRHLLTHTSGIEGDHFPDTGRGDDCVARYVESCADVGQSHALGATMSYCNSGFVIAGRVIEELTGGTWDQALVQRIVRPLGLGHTVTLPEEVLRFSGATGHMGDPPEVVPVWGLPRACGPAGLICATATDVVAFARLHLDKGRAPDGTQLLSPAGVAAMQEPQVAVPDRYTLGSHWGLGWILFDWGGRRLFGHDGGTIGQAAFLRVVPDADVAVALLTNGGNSADLYQELFRDLLAELAGIRMPARPAPPDSPIEDRMDLDSYVGLYERLGHRFEVARRGAGLVATSTVTGPLAALAPEPVTEHVLVAVDDGLFVTRQEGVQTWSPVVFYRLDNGSEYVHFGARATPKVG